MSRYSSSFPISGSRPRSSSLRITNRVGVRSIPYGSRSQKPSVAYDSIAPVPCPSYCRRRFTGQSHGRRVVRARASRFRDRTRREEEEGERDRVAIAERVGGAKPLRVYDPSRSPLAPGVRVAARACPRRGRVGFRRGTTTGSGEIGMGHRFLPTQDRLRGEAGGQPGGRPGEDATTERG